MYDLILPCILVHCNQNDFFLLSACYQDAFEPLLSIIFLNIYILLYYVLYVIMCLLYIIYNRTFSQFKLHKTIWHKW